MSQSFMSVLYICGTVLKYRMAATIGRELNLVDWGVEGRTTEIKSTNVEFIPSLPWYWEQKTRCDHFLHLPVPLKVITIVCGIAWYSLPRKYHFLGSWKRG